jgi:3-hydroxy acid dehydrogenase / malonic semialdehyde reductase
VELSGRTVVVTGASEGIGRATALELARVGARVVAAARSEERLDELTGEATGQVVPMAVDVTMRADRARLLEAAAEPDALVNNAGMAWLGAVEEMTDADLHRLFDLNVLALIDLTREALPGMLARRRGHVVNVGSVLGYVAGPPLAVYAATKSAVQGFTDGLRRELLGRGVDVTLVTPGAVQGTAVLDRAGGASEGSPVDVGFDLTGVPPEAVAVAVREVLERPTWLTTRARSVPRAAGLARLGTVPGLGRMVDEWTRRLRERSGGRLH